VGEVTDARALLRDYCEMVTDGRYAGVPDFLIIGVLTGLELAQQQPEWAMALLGAAHRQMDADARIPGVAEDRVRAFAGMREFVAAHPITSKEA